MDMTKGKKYNHRRDSGLIGAAGVYLVLSRLSQNGWTASMTSGNTKGTDIIAYKQFQKRGKKRYIFWRIEVKTCRLRSHAIDSTFWGWNIYWTLGKSAEELGDNLIYCFVNLEENFNPLTGKHDKNISHNAVYLAKARDVASFTKRAHRKWLADKRASHPRKDTVMRRFCLGFKQGKKCISTFFAEDCREKWDLLDKAI